MSFSPGGLANLVEGFRNPRDDVERVRRTGSFGQRVAIAVTSLTAPSTETRVIRADRSSPSASENGARMARYGSNALNQGGRPR